MKNLKKLLCLALMTAVLLGPVSAYAGDGENVSYVMQGATKMLGGVFAIPKAMLQDSTHILFPFGIVTGAVRGTVQTVTGVLGGAVDAARGAAPYAKYLVFL